MTIDLIICYFFFFQAEDGIRDTSVTGVQTCALPISLRSRRPAGLCPLCDSAEGPATPRGSALCCRKRLASQRSEERRVGKECRSRRPLEALRKRITKLYGNRPYVKSINSK